MMKRVFSETTQNTCSWYTASAHSNRSWQLWQDAFTHYINDCTKFSPGSYLLSYIGFCFYYFFLHVFFVPSVLWHSWLKGRKGIQPIKSGEWWRWAPVSPDGVASSRLVGVSASVNLPLCHKFQKFSRGTGSPGWSWKKGSKRLRCGGGGFFCFWFHAVVSCWRHLISSTATNNKLSSPTSSSHLQE